MEKIKSALPLILFAALAAIAIFFANDILNSKPSHMQGVIVEKLFVAKKGTNVAGPYGGTIRTNYFIQTQKEEQWIARVVMETGDTLIVHCLPSHYSTKQIGDIMHFKRYEGEHLHIQFFAHNEEEE
ncbi:MAG: hypothetical protein HOP08_06940 [Cyclobacteriaceae bacterium]|nr:hypothetical protein [Cyclobacteriaceae bacterium]